MLVHINQQDVAERVHNAWLRTIEDGIHTAGQSSQIADGAAAILLMSREKADELGLKARAVVTHTCLVGCDPVLMLEGPIPATQKLLAQPAGHEPSLARGSLHSMTTD